MYKSIIYIKDTKDEGGFHVSKTKRMLSLFLSIILCFMFINADVFAGGLENEDIQNESLTKDESVDLQNGWSRDDDNNTVYMENGIPVTGWKYIDGYWYHFKDNGAMESGWKYIDGYWYYFIDNGVMITGWKYIDDSWYHFRDNGVMESGWKYIDGSWYYFRESGVMESGWKYMDGSWYHFRESGVMESGWKYIDGYWYHFRESGVMESGWKYIDGFWYYFRDNGVMESGWKHIDGYWYYFRDNGVMTTGWKYIDGSWYYFGDSGYMHTGWIHDGTNWFYMKSDGTWDQEKSFNINTLRAKVEAEALSYSGSIGVYFKDMSTGESFIINDQYMYPCCMIKIAALATAHNEIEKGNLTYSYCKPDMEPMIIVSDNSAYNRLMAKIGQGDPKEGSNRVNAFLKDNGIYYTAVNNGLLPGSGYFNNGPKNYSCPSDIGKMLDKIYEHSLVSYDACEKMIDLLAKCDDDTALRKGIPSNITFAHKTGCAYDFYHDGGIVYGPNRDYILVVFTKGVSNYGRTFKNLSALVYDYEKSVY